MKILCQPWLLLSLLTLTGCGSSDQFAANGPTGAVASNTGTLRLRTQVKPDPGLPASQVIPAEVQSFRIQGFSADGVVVFTPPDTPKAAEVELPGLPTATSRLLIELLDGNGALLGAAVSRVNVQGGQIVQLANPDFLLQGATSNSSLAPEAVFTFASAQTSNPVDFSYALAALKIERSAPGVYSFSQSGEYLVKWNLQVGQGAPDTLVLATNLGELSQTAKQIKAPPSGTRYYEGAFYIDLQAGQTLSLTRAVNSGIPVSQGSLTVVWLDPL